MKRIEKILSLGCLLVLFSGLFPQGCLAENYDVSSESTLNSALTGISATEKALTINSDITINDNLQTPAGTIITINGDGKTLDGNGKAGFQIASGQTLDIYNYGAKTGDTITKAIENFGSLTMGGALYNSGNTTITNSIFSNNHVNVEPLGGAITSYIGTISISGSTFNGNFASSHGEVYGGAIAALQGLLDISNTTFTNNYATSSDSTSGGGAIISSEGLLTVSHSTFTNNYSVSDGAASSTSGGAILISSGAARVEGSTFTGNYTSAPNSSSARGGAIYNEGYTDSGVTYGSSTINNSTFEGNGISNYDAVAHTGLVETNFGGAIANRSGILGIYDSQFNYNKAINGGAIYNKGDDSDNIGTVNIYGETIFSHNSATSSGGAIYNDEYGILNVYLGSEFANNAAEGGMGGAIYNLGGAANVYDATFTNNSSFGGGAIINLGGGTVNVYDSTFTGNSAASIVGFDASGVGGAIANGNISSASTTLMTIYNCDFTNNYASLGGGAIANAYNSTTDPTLKIYKSTFTGNYTTEDSATRLSGGAIGNLNAITLIGQDSVFEGNGIQNYNTDTHLGTTMTRYGGAVANYWDKDSSITTSSKVTINDSTFQYNAATDQGGAVYNETEEGGTATVLISNSTFTNNSSKSNGGAIGNYVGHDNSTASVTISDSTFINNNVTNNGGAISNEQASGITGSTAQVDIYNSTFKGNNSSGGGAIMNPNGTVNVTDSTFGGSNFSDKNSSNYGGAINNDGTGKLTVTRSTFENNIAVTSGGAISNGNGSTTTIINSTFKNNTANTNGGAIYNYIAGTLNIVGDNGVTSFTGNKENNGNVSNDIVMIENGGTIGTINLYAGDSGYVIFNDGIVGKHDGSFGAPTTLYNININYPDITYARNGNAIFDCLVSNANITLSHGVLSLGTYSTSNPSYNYLNSTDSLTLSSGALNLANGHTDSISLNSLTSSADAGIFFDATVGALSNTSDSLSPTDITSDSELAIYGINITSDGGSPASTSLTLINSADVANLTLDARNTVAYTNSHKYTFGATSTDGTTAFSQAGSVGLYDAVHDATAKVAAANPKYVSFSATGDHVVSASLGTMNSSIDMLTIFGNEYTINGLNGGTRYSGLSLGTDQTLNIFNAGKATVDEDAKTVTVPESIQNFKTENATSSFIINNGGDVNIANSVFMSNGGYSLTTDAVNGGLISNSNSGTLNITNSVFDQNAATVNNGSNTKAYGGVIYNSATTNITGSTFSNNVVSADNKAANSGSADLCGGVIDNVGSGAVLTVSDSNFYSNRAIANFPMEGSPNSVANLNGGAIFNYDGAVTIYNSTFDGNNADIVAIGSGVNLKAWGGALYNNAYSSPTSMTIYNSTFSNNFASAGASDGGTATAYGGAIYNRSEADVATLSISNSIFTGNYAVAYGTTAEAYGGAIYNAGIIDYINHGSQFTANNAYRGGAIFNSSAGAINLIDNTTFTNNYAIYNGGAIYNDNGEITTISNSTFTGNYTTDSNSKGGAIYNSTSEASTINNSTFEGNGIKDYNTASPTTTTYLGGAIDNDGGDITINNSRFINNAATAYGGAVSNQSGIVNIADSIFTGNSSSVQGGGAITNEDTMTVSNSTFDNNSSNEAGAIANWRNLTLDNVAFTNNYAAVDAGAIGNWFSGASAVINNSTFIGNYTTNSGSYGGAIHNNGANLYVNNSIFEFNGIQNFGTRDEEAKTAYGGAIYNNEGTTLLNSTFIGNEATTAGGAIYNAGVLDIIADKGNATFLLNKANGLSNDIYLDTGSTLNLNAGNGGKITFGDGIKSSSSSNTIEINKTGTYSTNGSNSITSPTDGEVALKSAISGTDDTVHTAVNLYNGTLTLGKDFYLDGSNLALSGGTLNMQNSAAGTMALNSLAVAGNTNLKIDADLNASTSDMITGTYDSTNSVEGAKLNISSINLLNGTKNSSTSTQFLGTGLQGHNLVSLGVNRAYTPIYAYDVSYSDSTGMLTFGRGGSGGSSGFNPAVLPAPVSANVGAYMNQVTIYNESLSRSEMFMMRPLQARNMSKYANKYAAAGTSDLEPAVFSPTFFPETSGGLWFKQYVTFENVGLHNGPNVNNTGYCSLIGADLPMVSLKHGFDGALSLFSAYNGSHQYYDSVGIMQDGGAVGATGALYKGNFFTALTASIGDSQGQASTMYGRDNFNILLAGLAWKTGYNLETFEGKLIFQPSFLTSYTFANTFDYRTASGVNISSDPLNAMQIVPGFKIIGNLKNGWQPYIGMNMVWSIMDAQKFYANNVMLPQMSIDPYVEYGAGIQRRWGEKFTGFAQAMLRDGGRNGIALQLGFKIALGKDKNQDNIKNVNNKKMSVK